MAIKAADKAEITSIDANWRTLVTRDSDNYVRNLTLQGLRDAITIPLSQLLQSGAALNQVPKWNGSAWAPANESGGGGTPGGSPTQLQYNNSGAFGGIAGSAWNGTTLTMPGPAEISNSVSDSYTNAQNLIFSYAPAASSYNNQIQNQLSGNPANHALRIVLTSGGVTSTAVTFTANGLATFDYRPIVNTAFGIKTPANETPLANLEVRNDSLTFPQIMLALSYNQNFFNALYNSFSGSVDGDNILHFYICNAAGSSRTDVLRCRGNSVVEVAKNLGVKSATFGTNADGVLSLGSGTAPSSSPADSCQLYSADQAAGNACPHIRTENGAIVKLYQVAAYAPTNVVTDRSYDANATTLDELADVVGTLIADLQSTGLLG